MACFFTVTEKEDKRERERERERVESLILLPKVYVINKRVAFTIWPIERALESRSSACSIPLKSICDLKIILRMIFCSVHCLMQFAIRYLFL